MSCYLDFFKNIFFFKIAPHHSFIDARKFESVQKLSEYLSYLNSNDTAYAEYFEWKNFFRIAVERKVAFCQLCQALNNENSPEKVYHDLPKWWNDDANCSTVPWQ